MRNALLGTYFEEVNNIPFNDSNVRIVKYSDKCIAGQRFEVQAISQTTGTWAMYAANMNKLTAIELMNKLQGRTYE